MKKKESSEKGSKERREILEKKRSKISKSDSN